MGASIHVLGFAGSLRTGSFNKALLRAAAELLPEGMTLEIFDLAPIPMYNADIQEQGFPPSVRTFRERIAAADALLIATPEYNYSIPGVLKNAIDWASRPPDQPLFRKPVALMGASSGTLGTVRSQLALRQVFVMLNMLPVQKPEVLVANAQDKIDASGKLTDEITRNYVRGLLEALTAWTEQVRPRPGSGVAIR
jgi:chromate reductase, NAD(P)H dehydrogenase (quinone)